MKVSFSLSKKPGTSSSSLQLKKPPAPAQKPSLFNGDDDDESSLALDSKPDKKNGIGIQTVSAETSKAQKKRELAEMAVDSTVYQYDEIWDKIQVAKQKVKEAKVVESKERKPKYIEGLLASASTRKIDRLRAEEKMIQRERDMEGDEFKDKESFVTQAYKDQMAELREAEEEEKLRDEAEKKKRKGFGGGMAQFYQKLLEEEAKAHEETLALTTSSSSDPSSSKPVKGPNLTITKPPAEPQIAGAKSDLELATEAAQKGMDIELNDDNQIVDKRELLSAGLNLAMANTRKLGSKSSAAPSSSADASEPVNAHRAVGVAASRTAINTRRAREIQTQIAEEEERLRSERERREREARERIVAKRNNDEDIQSAKERYLARKRRKLEEEQVAQDEQQPDSSQSPV